MRKTLTELHSNEIRKTFLIVLSFLGIFLFLVFIFLLFNTRLREKEFTEYIEANLSYESIIPMEESRFLLNLKNATKDFSYRISSEDPSVCSRNNCYVLSFKPLYLKYFLPYFIIVFFFLLSFLYLIRRQKRGLKFIEKELSLINDILVSEKESSEEVLSEDLKLLINQLEEKRKLKELRLNQRLIDDKNKAFKQIAHDIRSPLESLNSLSAEIDNLETELKDVINSSTKRISSICNALLKNEYETDIKNTEIDLEKLLEDLVRDKKASFNGEFVFEKSIRTKPSLKGDELILYRCLSNLLNNAYESQEVDHWVKLEFASNDQIEINIIDRGLGMSKEFIEEVLSQGNISTKDKGNGLGLKYSYEHLKKIGFDVKIHSEVNVGTEVIINKMNEAKVKSKNIVLIDNDSLIHKMWQMHAKKVGVDLKAFISVEEFLRFEKENSLSKDVFIYVDSELDDGLLGEVESEKISNLGYKNIYLATGKDPADVNKPAWIIQVVGKRPEFPL